MVVEAIFSPFGAAKRPFTTGLLGFAYGTIALFLGVWVFEEHASLVMVFLATLATLPLFYQTIIVEEDADVKAKDKKGFFNIHSSMLFFLMALFIGVTVAFSFWYVSLPADTSNAVFKVQTQTIAQLNQQLTGSAAQVGLLSKIFTNNVKVMIFCLLFSFIFGAGAIFILLWNASVIGAAAGNFIRTHLASYADTAGLAKLGAYLYVSTLGVFRYALHGIPEILAYFIAGVVGGMLSVAVMRKDTRENDLKKIIRDSVLLVALSIAILLAAAFIEVFVTPVFF